MKKISLILVVFLLFGIFGCKKEVTPDNILSKKIKSIKYSNAVNDTFASYYFFYDSTSGNLHTVYLDSTLAFQITRQNNTTIFFHDYLNFQIFKITTDNFRIISIAIVDTTIGLESTVVNFYGNNTKIDSLFDVGMNPFSGYSFKYSNFLFQSNNSIGYISNWTQLVFGSATEYKKSDTIRMKYTNFTNTIPLPEQIPYATGYNYFGKVAYYLSINGYYGLAPNVNLLDSVITSSGSVLKYNYVLTASKVEQMSVGNTMLTIKYY